jgi:hypothetical protein
VLSPSGKSVPVREFETFFTTRTIFIAIALAVFAPYWVCAGRFGAFWVNPIDRREFGQNLKGET